MKLIEFTIEEMGLCFSALSYMFADHEAREEYKNLLLDNQMKFPHEHLDIISGTIKNYNGVENMLLDFEVVKTLSKLDQWNNLKDHSQLEESRIYFNAFIDKIKGNLTQLKDIPLIEYADNKQAFLSFVNGNLRALINSEDKRKFAYWNGKAWQVLTDEETQIIYGNFISQCSLELKENENAYEYKPYIELCKKVTKWNTDRNTKEALNYIRRNKSHIVDLKNYNANRNIICSNDGKIIDLTTGIVKKANRNDMILFTSKYNLMNKDDPIKFMNEKLSLYKDVLGQERLNFLLNFIAYKMLSKNLQLALFMIGSGGTGKSLFKNIIKDLFENNVQTIPYEYFTNNHKGNDDRSRDDILVSLDNKLLALSSESDNKEDQLINQARFKTILSNSTESARPTKGTIVEINLKRLDLLIDTNEMPKFANIDYAISRRLLFINFMNRIPIDKVNSNYYTEEITPNLDYVFSYFVYRAIDMIGKKIEIPSCIKDDTKQNIEGIDSVAKFANDKIIPMPGCWLKFKEIEKGYSHFCKDEDMPNIIPSTIEAEGKKCTIFTNALKEKLGYENIYSKRRSISRYDKTYVIYGITFSEICETDPFEDNQVNNIDSVENIKTFEVEEPKAIQQNILPKEPIKEPITWAK